jgi:hypothetical protein
LALHATQQLVPALIQLQFLQQLHLLLQFSLRLLSLQVLFSQLPFSQPSSLASLHHHLRQLLFSQLPFSRPSLPASALQVERRASNHLVQHERERGRLVAQ